MKATTVDRLIDWANKVWWLFAPILLPIWYGGALIVASAAAIRNPKMAFRRAIEDGPFFVLAPFILTALILGAVGMFLGWGLWATALIVLAALLLLASFVRAWRFGNA